MKTAVIDNDKIKVTQVENLTMDNQKGAIVKVLGCGNRISVSYAEIMLLVTPTR